MQVSHLVAVGFLPGLLSARGLPTRQDVICSFSVVPDEGQTCETFAQSWGLDVDSFRELNPDAECSDLDTSKEYCAIGTVTSSPSTPSTELEPSTDEPPTTSTDPTTSISTPSDTTAPDSDHEPAMPGLVADCDGFHKFLEWNPEIDDACSNIWLDYYVCVHVPGATTTTAGVGSTPGPTNGPTPQMPGISSDCKEFCKVISGDNCYEIEQEYDISLDQLISWNSELDEGCTNLWVDYYICVGL